MPTDEELFEVDDDNEPEKPKPAGLDIVSTSAEEHEAEDIPVNNDVDEPKTDEPTKTRREKRAERGRILDQLEERTKEMQALQVQLGELRGYVGALAQQPRQGQQHDPLQSAIDETYDQEDLLRQRAISLQQKGGGTAEEQRDLDLRARGLEQRRLTLITQKANRDSGIGPQDPNATARAIAAARFPDIHGNQQAADYMRLSFNREVAAGSAADDALLERVAAETRERFRLVRKPAPTSNNRARYTSTPNRTAAGRDPATVTHIHMGKAMKAIAVQAYAHRSDLNDRQKIELWAKTHGKKLQGNQSA